MENEVMIRRNGADSGTTIPVSDMNLAQCDACGDDLYVHEWIALDRNSEIYACDRV